MNKRQFLKNMSALAAVPAVVKAENLMKIWVPPEKKIITEAWSWDHETRNVRYIGSPEERSSIAELYEFLEKIN